jgi:dienelactone hydrolase
MPEPTVLPLTSHDGRPLRHKYFQHPGDARGVFIVFPGDNYGMDGPLLYYPSTYMYQTGWDTFAMTYGYQSQGGEFNIGEIPEIVEECSEAVRHILSARRYGRIALAGKSLGAGVVGVLCQSVPELSACSAIFITPPLSTPFFTPVFKELKQRSYLAVGTGDRYFDERILAELQERRDFQLHLIEDADHSLNVPGDLSRSLQVIEAVTEGISRWLLEGAEPRS